MQGTDIKCNIHNVWDKWIRWSPTNAVAFKKTKSKIDTAIGNGERKLAAEISSTITKLGGQNDPTDINDTYRDFGFGYISVKEFSLKCKDVRLGKQSGKHYANFLEIFINAIHWWLATYYYLNKDDIIMRHNIIQHNKSILAKTCTPLQLSQIETIRKHLMEPIDTDTTTNTYAVQKQAIGTTNKVIAKKGHVATKKVIAKKGFVATAKGKNKTALKGGVPTIVSKKDYSLYDYIGMGEICASRLPKLHALVLAVSEFATPYMDFLNSYALGFNLSPEPSSWHLFLGDMQDQPPHIKAAMFTYMCNYLHINKISIDNFEVLDKIARQEALGGPKIQNMVNVGNSVGLADDDKSWAYAIKNLHKEDEPVLVIVNENCGFYFVGEKTINQVKATRVSQRGVKLGFSKDSLIYNDCIHLSKQSGNECYLPGDDKDCGDDESDEDAAGAAYNGHSGGKKKKKVIK